MLLINRFVYFENPRQMYTKEIVQETAVVLQSDKCRNIIYNDKFNANDVLSCYTAIKVHRLCERWLNICMNKRCVMLRLHNVTQLVYHV